jgi:hypothetical protein
MKKIQPTPSEYELNAIKEIHKWKTPELTAMDDLMKKLAWPFEKAGEYLHLDKISEIDFVKNGQKWVIENVCGGIISLLNDVAQYSVRTDAIINDYKKNGVKIDSLNDISNLDLEKVDQVIGYLAAKYKTSAGIEGAATGYFGLPGIAPDILALLSLNLRAIGEYSNYCGFDNNLQHERMFSMNVLGLASSPTDSSKQMAMAQLVKIAKEAAMKKAWKDLEKHVFVKIMQNIAKALGVRLTKAKLAQMIPKTGSIIGFGFNVAYTNRVCNASYNLYREKFIARKYGENFIEETVNPAEDFETEFDDE